jgi:hypothetical protein
MTLCAVRRAGRARTAALAALLGFGAMPGTAGAVPVEVQLNVCAPPQAVVTALALRPHPPVTEVWLFETPALALANAGVRLRLRMRDGAAPELTAKFANADCRAAPKHGAGKCEADLHGDALVDTLSLTQSLSRDAAAALVRDPGTLPAYLAPAQRRALEQRIGAWPAAVRALGPMRVAAYVPRARDFVVEAWTLPDGTELTEASKRVSHPEAVAEAARLAGRLSAAGVALCADQSSQSDAKLRALLR